MTPPASPRIGLVLGAGGITGFAYHAGVLSALGRLTGWDPRTADVIVGTSAGSGVGAMLRGGVPVDEVLAHLLAAPSNPETMTRLRVLSGREFNSPSWLWFGPGSPRLLLEELRKPWKLRPSRLATALIPNGRIPTEFLGDRARQLHALDWPDESYWVCAMRLSDGQRVVFGRNEADIAAASSDAHGDVGIDVAGVDVGTAVEASSAIPGFFQPVWIHSERYIDGAIHSPTNADLIGSQELDLDLVVIVSPMSGECRPAVRSMDALSRLTSGNTLKREVAGLRDMGHEVLVLEPGAEEIQTMGPINMDPTRMVPTVLQASASTLQRLVDPRYEDALATLQEAADATTSPPVVPYPEEVTSRIS